MHKSKYIYIYFNNKFLIQFYQNNLNKNIRILINLDYKINISI